MKETPKLIIGAGGQKQDGWISTEESQLDILKADDFAKYLNGGIGYDIILSEHVAEHMTIEENRIAFKNIYDYLIPMGRFRIAVPDGYHNSQEYIEYVKPEGLGAGSNSHKILFNYQTLGELLREVGFIVKPLEWWDENHKFHAVLWNEIDGNITRCLASDARNNDGKPHYTSLIMDGFKMNDTLRPNLTKAFDFVEAYDIYKLSPFNRKKTTSYYELARLAPAGGSIVELGSFQGMGTAALWYGTRDGHRCPLICIDPYSYNVGWAGEVYEQKDKAIFEARMKVEKIKYKLLEGYDTDFVENWNEPISLLMCDLPNKGWMPKKVPAWEKYVIKGGLIGLRDIDDFSMGTEATIRYLQGTGRWGNRKNWDGFITSIERI